MSVSFTPTNGSTIAFGNVIVGSNASQSWTIHQVGSQSYYQTDSIIMSGAGNTDFTSGDPGPLYGVDSNSASIVFTPAALGAVSVTMTVTYELGSNGIPNGNLLTLIYTLTGTGISNPSPPPATEVTSLLQSFRYLLVPSQGTTGKVLSFYDTTSLDDASDASTYTFKAEDLTAVRVPTVRRVMITYIDLGVATLHVSVTAVNDNGVIVTEQTAITIGTVGATQNICTAFADLSVTGYRPQVQLFRAAGGGPVFISHVVASGTIEKGGTL
jgi:hypothetical protein